MSRRAQIAQKGTLRPGVPTVKGTKGKAAPDTSDAAVRSLTCLPADIKPADVVEATLTASNGDGRSPAVTRITVEQKLTGLKARCGKNGKRRRRVRKGNCLLPPNELFRHNAAGLSETPPERAR
jgi:hypothetical protein